MIWLNTYIYTSDNFLISYKENIDNNLWEIFGYKLQINIYELIKELPTEKYKIYFELVYPLLYRINDFYFFKIKEISGNKKELIITTNKQIENDIYVKSLSKILKKNFSQDPNYFLYDDNLNLKNIILRIFKDSKIYDYNIVNYLLVDDYTIAIKLNKELDNEIDIDDEIFIYEIPYQKIEINVKLIDKPKEKEITVLTTPNTDIKIIKKDKQTKYYNYEQISSEINDLTKINKELKINVDYTNFKNFIFYSSAYERISNFEFKVKKIFDIQHKIDTLTNSNNYIDLEKKRLEKEIEKIKSGFTQYEHFLWFENNSPYTYPKDSNGENIDYYDLTVKNWFQVKKQDAQIYDNTNLNLLIKAIPFYIFTDNKNYMLFKFINILAEIFDNLWLYIKNFDYFRDYGFDINEKLPKRLISIMLENMGIKTNSEFSDINLDEYYNKQNSNNQITIKEIKLEDYEYEIWKRLLINLPYIYKTKGTKNSIRALLNIFGIPVTSIRIYEYGGKWKNKFNSYYIYDKFYYALNKTTNSNIIVENIKPRAFQIRIKPDENLLNNLKNNPDTKFIIFQDINSQFQIYFSYNDIDKYSLSIDFNNTNLIQFNNVNLSKNNWINIHFGIVDVDYDSDVLTNNKLKFSYIITEQELIKDFNIKTLDIIDNDLITFFNTETNIELLDDITGLIQEIRIWSNWIYLNNFKYHSLNPMAINLDKPEKVYSNLLVRLALGTNLNKEIINISPNKDYRDNFSIAINFISEFVGLVEKIYKLIPDFSNNHIFNNRITYNDLFIEDVNIIYLPNEGKYIIDDDNSYIKTDSLEEVFSFSPSYDYGSFDFSFDFSFEVTEYNSDLKPLSNDNEYFDKSLSKYYKTDLIKDNFINRKLLIGFSPAQEIDNEYFNMLGLQTLDDYFNTYKSDYLYNLLNKENNHKFLSYKFVHFTKQYNKTFFSYLNNFVPLSSKLDIGLKIENVFLKRNKFVDELEWINKNHILSDVITPLNNFSTEPNIHETIIIKVEQTESNYYVWFIKSDGSIIKTKKFPSYYRYDCKLYNDTKFINTLFEGLSYFKLNENAKRQSEEIDTQLENPTNTNTNDFNITIEKPFYDDYYFE